MPAERATVVVLLNRGVGDDISARSLASVFEGIVFERKAL
jgi:hypothetical protein